MDESAVLESVITCPHCGHRQQEVMPADACQFFYECPKCKMLLRPKPGDCCVFCSYGSVPCPPVQREKAADEKIWISVTAIFLSFVSTFMPGDVYEWMAGVPISASARPPEGRALPPTGRMSRSDRRVHQ